MALVDVVLECAFDKDDTDFLDHYNGISLLLASKSVRGDILKQTKLLESRLSKGKKFRLLIEEVE